MLPVELSILAAFAVTAGAIVLSPGPDTLLILRHSLSSGTRVGLATVLGVQIGILVHTMLAVAGVSLLIASSPVLFKGVAVAGALYLGWLGIQGFRAEGALSLGRDRAAIRARRAFVEAILTNLLNPKVVLLFLALFPQFITASRPVTPQLLTLSLVLIVINVAWQAPMPVMAGGIRRWLANPTAQKLVSRGTGIIFIGFGLLMLWEHLGP